MNTAIANELLSTNKAAIHEPKKISLLIKESLQNVQGVILSVMGKTGNKWLSREPCQVSAAVATYLYNYISNYWNTLLDQFEY